MTVGRPTAELTATTRPNTQPHALAAMPTQISGHGPVNTHAIWGALPGGRQQWINSIGETISKDNKNFNATSI